MLRFRDRVLRFRVLGASCFGLRFRVLRFRNYHLSDGIHCDLNSVFQNISAPAPVCFTFINFLWHNLPNSGYPTMQHTRINLALFQQRAKAQVTLGLDLKKTERFCAHYNNMYNMALFNNSPFPSSPRPLYQNKVKCSAFDMKIIFHSHAYETYFHKKSCALGLILRLRVYGTRKWPIHSQSSIVQKVYSITSNL